MAAYRGIRQSWGILSGWDPCGRSAGVCPAFERDWPLDWTECWISSAIFSAFPRNKLHKLGKRG